jgi:Holliday junction resolvase RusA-like endonuclease
MTDTVRCVSDRHIVRIEVNGRPATFATTSEVAWKAAVRAAVEQSGCKPPDEARFAVRIDFRLAEAKTTGEVWDLDNLIKPTLDAMEGVFGLRPWKGHTQPADDRVDRIEAQKRQPTRGEQPGATIDV